MKQTKVSLVHIYLIQKLVKECRPFSNVVDRSKAEHEIFCLRIPRNDYNKIIKELEEIGFVEKSDNKKIVVNKDKFNDYTSWF